MRSLLKPIAILLALFLTVVGCQVVRNSGDAELFKASDDHLRVATYNVHYINMRETSGPWSEAGWLERRNSLNLAFQSLNADVIAFQEMETFDGGSQNSQNLTLDWLLDNNPGYAAGAVGDTAKFPSTQPILYRRARLTLVEQGWFFFSEMPDVIYSRTFNGSYPAFASWAIFDGSVAGRFRVVNIHTDFRSRSNRMQSLELVAKRIRPWVAAGETIFVMGDLNARLGSDALAILEAEGVTFAPVDGATYHFNRGLNIFGAIDHIGVAGAARISGDPVIVRRKFDNRWPTDHYPVVADYTAGQR